MVTTVPVPLPMPNRLRTSGDTSRESSASYSRFEKMRQVCSRPSPAIDSKVTVPSAAMSFAPREFVPRTDFPSSIPLTRPPILPSFRFICSVVIPSAKSRTRRIEGCPLPRRPSSISTRPFVPRIWYRSSELVTSSTMAS